MVAGCAAYSENPASFLTNSGYCTDLTDPFEERFLCPTIPGISHDPDMVSLRQLRRRGLQLHLHGLSNLLTHHQLLKVYTGGVAQSTEMSDFRLSNC